MLLANLDKLDKFSKTNKLYYIDETYRISILSMNLDEPNDFGKLTNRVVLAKREEFRCSR